MTSTDAFSVLLCRFGCQGDVGSHRQYRQSQSSELPELGLRIIHCGSHDKDAVWHSVLVRYPTENQTLAERLWPGESALGKQIWDEAPPDGRPRTVVGVARDAKYRSLGESPRPFVYVPLAQNYNSTLSLFVRPQTGAANLAPAFRSALAEMNPNLPIVNVRTLGEATQLGLIPQRLALSLAASLGMVGLLLAALGIYAITAHSVQQRTREIGIRSALGAPRAALMRMILSEGMRSVLLGSAAGLAGAAGLAQLIQGLLYGTSPLDPASFVGTALLVFGIALAACYLPARRAAALDPAQVLRHD